MSKEADATLRDGYNFSNGVRGKYRHFSGQTRTLKVRHPNSSVAVEKISPTTEIDPDVQLYFRDSEAVNKALRELTKLVPRDKSVASS